MPIMTIGGKRMQVRKTHKHGRHRGKKVWRFYVRRLNG